MLVSPDFKDHRVSVVRKVYPDHQDRVVKLDQLGRLDLPDLQVVAVTPVAQVLPVSEDQQVRPVIEDLQEHQEQPDQRVQLDL